MSTLAQELDRYLTLRRNLGYHLHTAERVLRKFIVFAEKAGADHVTIHLFLRWKEAFGHAHRTTWAARLGIVRRFAQWLHGLDARHEVPPQALLPYRYHRSRPYIYRPEEIRRLISAAAELPSANGISRLTYSTLFGLIAVTGLRISEAIALNVDDVDLESGILTIRRGKLGKARLLPLSNSTQAQLAWYAKERDRLLGARATSFFVSDQGKRPTDWAVRYHFAVLCQRIGLRPAQRFHRHGRGPRIHDLRHTFAVQTLLNWYRSGQDPAQEMIRLTTYLGHARPVDTYWYIEAVPELMQLAAQRSSAALAKEGQE
jgi:integrase/recombinase XerD